MRGGAAVCRIIRNAWKTVYLLGLGNQREGATGSRIIRNAKNVIFMLSEVGGEEAAGSRIMRDAWIWFWRGIHAMHFHAFWNWAEKTRHAPESYAWIV